MPFRFLAAARQRTLLDFYFLHNLFSKEIKRLLPVPATPVFWCRSYGFLPPTSAGLFTPGFTKELGKVCDSGVPGLHRGIVVVPLATEEEEHVAVILQGIDPDLAGKMAPEWLAELQSDISEKLLRAARHYIQPETGLYNSRLLDICLDRKNPSSTAALYLLNIQQRSRKTMRERTGILRTARLLEGLATGPVFYLGGSLYCIYLEGVGRDDAMNFSRRLISRLKREGVQQVHIGIALQDSEIVSGREQDLLRQCRQALEAAEHRGPYSLCEASSLVPNIKHPLARPQEKCLRQLRRAWRGQKQFGLLLFRLEEPQPGTGHEVSLADRLAEHVAGKAGIIPMSPTESFVIFPGLSGQESVRTAKKLKRKLDANSSEASIALGIAYWPCLSFSRTETVRNCRRALMHGDFFGPGSVTVFNHVSLNVSGDSFFDEGDYRQAVKDYRNGLQMSPDNVNLLNSLGVALTELNRHREAGRYFEKVLAREPGNFMALVNKGFSLRRQGKHAEAIGCFEKASRSRKFPVSSVFPDISLQLARLYCDEGRYGKALKVLRRLEKNHPDKPGFLFYSLLGEACSGAGKNREAIDALQYALRLNPHDARSLSMLGELYAREGQGDDIALSFCEKALALDESSWQHWYRLALVKEHTADLPGALDAARKALQRSRRNAECMFLAGRLYARLGERRKALAIYRRLDTMLPGNREVLRMRKTLEAK